MPISAWMPMVVVDMVWLGAGLFAGGAMVAAWHRLSAWRAERANEWDPY
jgi:hypothetical protein